MFEAEPVTIQAKPTVCYEKCDACGLVVRTDELTEDGLCPDCDEDLEGIDDDE